MKFHRSGVVLLPLLGAIVGACASSGGELGPKASPQRVAATHMQLAIEYMKLGKLADSRTFVERALKEDPGNANVQLTAGLVYERVNEMPAAERAYATAARLGKSDPNIQNNYAGFLCRTGKAAAGEKLFGEVARNPLYQTPEVALVNAGVCVRAAGDLLDAERYFAKALVIRPNMPEALLQLGNVANDRGDAADALAYVQRYLAANPATPEVLWLGFRAQRKLGDGSAAAAFAHRVQTEFPNSEQAQLMRAGVDR
ncbi:MAG: type IV pilus biogenesis/stability protein PilW [Pseudomonadota bacterium]|nr:type IV pilus biogenesis/stability protein PilW [Pseudomonadota bacterium]